MDIVLFIIGFLLIGCVAGFFSSLAGMGATLVILPVLMMLLPHLLPHVIAIKVAIATTLAGAGLIIIKPVMIKIKSGYMLWRLFWIISVIYLLTAAVGAYVIHYLPGHSIELIVGIALLVIGVRLFRRKITHHDVMPTINRFFFTLAIVAAGLLSSICGVATGTIAIPYLSRHVPYRQAMTVSISCALVFTVFVTVAYIIYGWHVTVHMPYLLGYVYWPVVLCVFLGSLIGTSIGHQLSEKVDVHWIKCVLSILILMAAISSLVRFAIGSV